MKARILLLTTSVMLMMLTVIMLTKLVSVVTIAQALPIWTANDGHRGFDTTTLIGRTPSPIVDIISMSRIKSGEYVPIVVKLLKEASPPELGGIEGGRAVNADISGDFNLLSETANLISDTPFIREVPFGSGIPITTSADGAHSVYTADLDSDGDLDVISASRNDGHIVWYENNGATFPTSHVISTNGAYSIFATDVEGDGDIDILSAARETNQITWYENDGSTAPTFTSHIISTNASNARQIVAADVDGDGDMDVLSASRSDNKIAWYENNGASPPIFTPYVITNSAIGAVSVHTADMDGDGDMDVLSASELDNKIAWYENNNGQPADFTTHVISEQQILEEGARSVYAADADGDGDMDVFYVSENENKIAWFENKGGSPLTFTDHIIISTDVAIHPKEIYAADIDSDGDIDALSALGAADEVAWHQNDGTSPPTFSSYIVTTDTDYARSVYAADLDSDGDLDLLSASKDDDKVAWYPNNTIHRRAAFPVQAQSVINTLYKPRSVYAADMNKDGELDVLSVSENQVTWYENNGSSALAFTTHLISTDLTGGRWVYSADLDSDGDQDVLSASLTKIAWYENDGNSSPAFTSHLISSDIDKGRSVHAVDLDGDGDLDVFSTSSLDDKVAWYENDGGSPPTFITHIITTNADKARSAYAADMDGDGDLDLLSASQEDDTVAWYENDGGGSPLFTTHIISTNADGVQSVHAADVDGDGDIDVLSGSEHDNKIAWYENDGAALPTFTTHIVTTNAPGVHAVYTGDADGDGDLDLFAAIEYNNTIAWYENNGSSPPLFTSQVITDTAEVAHAVYVADMDKDGDLDVLSASREDGKIAWYENRGGQFALFSRDTAPDLILYDTQDDVLQIVATHLGRLSDTDYELTTFQLLFEDSLGNSLTTEQVNNLLESLHIYRDDGSGSFEASTDTLVTTVSPLSLTPTGQQTVTFVDGDPNVQVPFGTAITYFVVVELTPHAASQTPNSFRVTHLVAKSSAEDRENDIALQATFSENVTSGISTAIASGFVINEFMASNQTILEDPDEPGEFPDWIEIHNVGTQEADLAGLYLTDDLTDPTKFKITANIIVPSGAFVLFYADNEPEQGAFHTNFTLSQKGGTIGIFSDREQIDAYTFGPQVTSLSEGRYPDGADNWRSFTVPTPGEPNLLIKPTISQVMHTPAQPMATDMVTVTATIIDDGLLLTTTLYYTATKGGTAVPMVWQGNDLYAAQIPAQLDDSLVQYYVLAQDNDGLSSTNPLDAPNDLYQYLVGYEPPSLFINEFMAKNRTTLEDPDEASDFPDWIELYNPSSTPIELGGMYLTDDLSETSKFRITDSISIAAEGFVLFYADGEIEQGAFHSNFKLSKEGESIGLFSSNATGNYAIDTYTFGTQRADVSEGREPDGEDNWRLFSLSTPGESNVFTVLRTYLPIVHK
jgi:hypothetical protein